MHFLAALRISFQVWVITFVVGSLLNLLMLEVAGIAPPVLSAGAEKKLILLWVFSAIVTFPGMIVFFLCMLSWVPRGQHPIRQWRRYAMSCMVLCIGLGYFGILLVAGIWLTNLVVTAPLYMLVACGTLAALPRSKSLTWESGNAELPPQEAMEAIHPHQNEKPHL